ncbi:site-2 protease family protein [Olsenella sp. YH-ols2217]|uniref:Site-2 protease family protein n=1 Tax=Kribbibacterium absianum TaxID=3044210 RepID=A0ABT6ZIP2_9ACTN|nr:MULTISPECIES: site-2 protease family protein [unclassified Olsenella]MDJ1121435.1 site-2 protease family protein [Olsenella sp. YH-ols2216]MDJ1128925.1 site-2 protease family protein [Olsenella sp. YH-ols2217]
MSLTPTYFVNIAVSVAVVMWAATLHEVAHGYVAYRCGDPTAKNAGRLTLNPLKHLDLFGSVILPLVMALLGGPVFGYAKPVPYNPNNLRHRRRDEVLVAMAGPASNLLQALLGMVVWRIWLQADPAFLLASSGAGYWVCDVLTLYVWVNLILCFFNLIPLPPLDGSHLIAFFLHGRALDGYYKLSQYSMPLLIVLLYLLPDFLHVDPLGVYFNATAGSLYDLMMYTNLPWGLS